VRQPAQPGQRLAQLATAAANASTPRAALRGLRELRHELEAFERRQVAHALADGASFAAIARDLGLSRQAVHRRFRGVTADDAPLLMTPDGRRVLQYAREEAQATHAAELGSEHILLGVLRSDAAATAVLEGAGATLERARTQIEGAAPRGRLFQREQDPGDPRALLEAPAREVRERGGHRIEVEHLLLAALDDPDGGAARALGALGVDPAAIRDALTA
jgi:AraC-like DNA-binding protein